MIVIVGRQRSWLVVAVTFSLWLVLDGAADVISVAAVVAGVDFCAATGADVLDLSESL